MRAGTINNETFSVFCVFSVAKHFPMGYAAHVGRQGVNPGRPTVVMRPAGFETGAARNRLGHFSPRPGSHSHRAVLAGTHCPVKNVDATTRKPLFVFLLFGLLLLRYAQRTFSA